MQSDVNLCRDSRV